MTPVRAAPIGGSYSAPQQEQGGGTFGRFRIDSESMANAISVGASAPGYIMERPIAALNQVTGGAAKSFIDQAGDTIRNIPIAGDLLSGATQAVGNTYEGFNRLTRAPVNAGMMNALRSVRGKAPTDKVDGITAWLSGAGGIAGDLTVAELWDIAKQRGFTDQDVEDVAQGRRSIFDYADKQLSNNPMVNLAGTLAVDPTNLILLGGAGALAKGAAKGAELLTGGRLSLGVVDRMSTGMKAFNAAIDTSRAAPSTLEGMRWLASGKYALEGGNILNVPLNTVARYIAAGMRGGGDALKLYRKAAYVTTGAQLGAQALENSPISNLTEPIWQAAKRMAEDRPLSQSSLFNLWSAVNFPIRRELSETWTNTRNPVVKKAADGTKSYSTAFWKRKTDIERRVVQALAPEAKSVAEARTIAHGMFNGEQGFLDFLHHNLRSFVMEHQPEWNAFTNVRTHAELALTGDTLVKAADTLALSALERGAVTGRDIAQFIKDKATGARSFDENGRPVTGRVRRAWDPQAAATEWNGYVQHMNELYLRGGYQRGNLPVVQGIADSLLPKEWLKVAEVVAKDMSDAQGNMTREDVRRFLDMFPGLTADANDASNFFARLQDPEAPAVTYQMIRQRLKALRDSENAITLRQYLWSVEKWETRQQRISLKRGRVFDEYGNPDGKRAPVIGDAGMILPSTGTNVMRAMGVKGEGYEGVLRARGIEAVNEKEMTLAPALEELGAGIEHAAQGVTSDRGRMRPSVSIGVTTSRGPSELVMYAAIIAKHAKAPFVRVLISGTENLAKHRLAMNAVHIRFDIGNIAEVAQTDAILEAVTRRFDGRYDFTDTAGVLDLYIKQGETDLVNALTDDITGILGEGRFTRTERPAWVETVYNDTRGAIRSGREGQSARAILAANHDTLQVANAERAFRTAKAERGGALGADAPGFTGGPRRTGPGVPPVDADGRGVGPEAPTSPGEPSGVSGQPLGENGAPGQSEAIQEPSLTDLARGTQGKVLHLAEADDNLAHMTPHMGADLAGLPPAEWAKVKDYERELRLWDPTYRLKVAPHVKDSTVPRGAIYYAGQGNAIKDILAASRAAGDLWQVKYADKAADFFDKLVGPVYTRRLAQDAKQRFYQMVFKATEGLDPKDKPTIREIDAFLETLAKRAEQNTVFINSRTGRMDLVSPRDVNEVADGTFARAFGHPNPPGLKDPMFFGFSREAMQAINATYGDVHKMLDISGSRFYRDLRERVKSDGGKKGELGRAIGATYGLTRKTTATPRLYIRAFYHLVRFTANPWWHVLNRLESDILGLVRYGITRSKWERSGEMGSILMSRDRKAFAAKMKGLDASDMPAEVGIDVLSSGYMPARNVEAARDAAFKSGRLRDTREFLKEYARTDPGAVNALQRFGGSIDDWVDGIDDLMYNIDNRGVQQTMLGEALRSIGDEASVQQMMPLITRLMERHRTVWDDVTHTFYGNVNRSNLERIFNSYFLFWPLSYQLKTAKWMFDTLTKSAMGRDSNFAGLWTLDRLYKQHVNMLAEDEDYQRMFIDNPALWQTAAMLLPAFPYDEPGVSLSRITRFSLAAGGFIRDEQWENDPFMAAVGLGALGVVYNIELAKRIKREFNDDPKDLEYPVKPAA